MMIMRVCSIVLMVDVRLMSMGDDNDAFAFAVADVTSCPSSYSHSTQS